MAYAKHFQFPLHRDRLCDRTGKIWQIKRLQVTSGSIFSQPSCLRENGFGLRKSLEHIATVVPIFTVGAARTDWCWIGYALPLNHRSNLV